MPGKTRYAAARINLIRTGQRKGWNIAPIGKTQREIEEMKNKKNGGTK